MPSYNFPHGNPSGVAPCLPRVRRWVWTGEETVQNLVSAHMVSTGVSAEGP